MFRKVFRGDPVVATQQLNAPPAQRSDRYHVTVEQYINFRRNGFAVVPQLVDANDVAELRQHTDDLMQGKLPEQRQTMAQRELGKDTGVTGQGLEAPPPELS